MVVATVKNKETTIVAIKIEDKEEKMDTDAIEEKKKILDEKKVFWAVSRKFSVSFRVYDLPLALFFYIFSLRVNTTCQKVALGRLG